MVRNIRLDFPPFSPFLVPTSLLSSMSFPKSFQIFLCVWYCALLSYAGPVSELARVMEKIMLRRSLVVLKSLICSFSIL